MGLRDLLKGKKKVTKQTSEQKMNIKQVSTRHKIRIDNLLNESEALSDELLKIEKDETVHKTEKVKSSNRIIQRLTLIKYEVGIRKDLVSWL